MFLTFGPLKPYVLVYFVLIKNVFFLDKEIVFIIPLHLSYTFRYVGK